MTAPEAHTCGMLMLGCCDRCSRPTWPADAWNGRNRWIVAGVELCADCVPAELMQLEQPAQLVIVAIAPRPAAIAG